MNHTLNSSNLTESINKSKHKKSTHKNIKQTQLNLRQIKRYEEKSYILPFSLKQHKKTDSDKGQINYAEEIQNSRQSDKWLGKFESRNALGTDGYDTYKNIEKQNQPNNNQSHDSSHIFTNKSKPSSLQHATTNSPFQSPQNTIMLQIHLTIAKKKYTVKVSSRITSEQLQQVIENFLIQNQISSPTKRSHKKTKLAIIQMVQSKLQQPIKRQSQQNDGENKLPLNEPNQQQDHKQQMTKGKQPLIREQNMIKKQPHNNTLKGHNQLSKHSTSNNLQSSLQHSTRLNPQAKQPTMQNSSINYYQQDDHQQQQQEEICSPSFKSSAYVETRSPIRKTSNFSPEPKHKNNKYEKIVSNYYYDRVNEDQIQDKSHKGKKGKVYDSTNITQKKEQLQSPSPSTNNIKNPKDHQSLNFSHQSTEQQRAKSVYEKWKQRQKSKDINGKAQNKNDRQNFTNALKQRRQTENTSFMTQMSQEKRAQKKQKNWNATQRIVNKDRRRPQSRSITYNYIKQKQLKQETTKGDFNTKLNKQNHVNKKSLSSKKLLNNPNMSINLQCDHSPGNKLNRTQIIYGKRQNDDELYSPNKYIRQVKEASQQVITPGKGRKSIPHPSNFDNNSKVFTICDQSEYPNHELTREMSPDHFYKQGLLFEAKKKLELEQKFKSLYPFTTRNLNQEDSNVIQADRNSLIKNGNCVTSKASVSRDKYFSSKMSMNKAHPNTKSSTHIALDEKQKSALHERLYQQNKTKQAKLTTVQLNQKFIKISKAPQNPIKTMQQNLKNIKGLSEDKKIKLIERNLKIKQKIKQKDRIIDEQLEKMIKQGKVKPTCKLMNVKKSPFRKTQFC